MKKLVLAAAVSGLLIGCGGDGSSNHDGGNSDGGNSSQPEEAIIPEPYNTYTTEFTEELYEVAAIHNFSKENIDYICSNEMVPWEGADPKPFIIKCEVSDLVNQDTGIKDLIITIPSIFVDVNTGGDFWTRYKINGHFMWTTETPSTLKYMASYKFYADESVDSVTATPHYSTYLSEASTVYDYNEGLHMRYTNQQVDVDGFIVDGMYSAEIDNNELTNFQAQYYFDNNYWLRGYYANTSASKQGIDEGFIEYSDIFHSDIRDYNSYGQPVYSTITERKKRLFKILDLTWM